MTTRIEADSATGWRLRISLGYAAAAPIHQQGARSEFQNPWTYEAGPEVMPLYEVDAVTGARVHAAAGTRLPITIDPDGNDAVTITLPGNRGCGTTGAICSKEENPFQTEQQPVGQRRRSAARAGGAVPDGQLLERG